PEATGMHQTSPYQPQAMGGSTPYNAPAAQPSLLPYAGGGSTPYQVSAKPYFPPYTGSSYTPYQAGTSNVGGIGYVSPQNADPAWTQIALSAPGLNLAALKEAAQRSKVSPSQLAGLISAIMQKQGVGYGAPSASSLASSGYGFGGSQQIPIQNTGVPVSGYQAGSSNVSNLGITPHVRGFIPFEHRSVTKGLVRPPSLMPKRGYQSGTSDVERGDAVYR